jgi:hypothetical protein
LGVVTTRSSQISDLGLNHQVLAYGYAQTPETTTLCVYDPNLGRNDGALIRFRTGFPDAIGFEHNPDVGHEVRGFFRSSYSPEPPPADATAVP